MTVSNELKENNKIKKQNLKKNAKSKLKKGFEIADCLANISEDEYENLDRAVFFKDYSVKNIKRVARVISITKKKKDNKNDFLLENSPERIKALITEVTKDEKRILKQTGVPSFLKKKFKLKTLESFKNYKGMFLA